MRSWRRIAYIIVLAMAGPSFSAQANPPPIEAYGDLPSVEDMAISSNGKGLATVIRIRGERRLLASEIGGSIRAAHELGDTKVRDIAWAGDDIVIVTTSVTEKLPILFIARQTETFGTIILDLKNNETAMVFDNRKSIASATYGPAEIRSVDGEWRGYFKGIEFKRQPGTMDYSIIGSNMALYAVDLERNQPSMVASSKTGGFYQDWLLDERGNVVAELELNRSSGQWAIKNAGSTVLASGTDPTGDVSLIAINHHGRSIIYGLEDDNSGIVRWYEVPLGGGAAREILENVGVRRPYVDPASGRMLGYQPTGRRQKPVMFDTGHQSIFDKIFAAFPSDLKIVEWTPSFSHFIVLTHGNGDSGTYFLVDLAQSKADPIGNERMAIPPEAVGPISTVAYEAADGLEMDGILTLPPGRDARNLPVILFPHGGPHAHDPETFDWWAQAFASRGYAVFQPNFRGSTNRDDAFRRAGYGQWGRKMQTDISDGVAELARRGIVDPDRACIMGASYGGYAALAGITLQNGLYRCAVAVAPVSDLRVLYNNASRQTGRDKLTMSSLQESLGAPTGFDEVSPMRFADRADAPVLLIHGKDDTVVNFEHSSKMADALKDAGKPYELVVLREEDHWLSRAETRKQMLEEAMRFVKAHNPPD